jgi:hypothetical protein
MRREGRLHRHDTVLHAQRRSDGFAVQEANESGGSTIQYTLTDTGNFVPLGTLGGGGPFGAIIPADNPYNPFGTQVGIFRYAPELGLPNSQAFTDTYTGVAGIKGSLLDKRFQWDISYTCGRSNIKSLSYGNYNVEKLTDSLDPALGCNTEPGGCVICSVRAR